MHPGWCDTEGVRTSIPGFHKAFKQKLRDVDQGVDTVVWLALEVCWWREGRGGVTCCPGGDVCSAVGCATAPGVTVLYAVNAGKPL
jgi:hypothetical protein